MRFISILLAVFAAFFSTLIIGLIGVILWKGDFNVIIPSLGLVISGYFIILLLAAVDAAIIFLALFFRAMSKRN